MDIHNLTSLYPPRRRNPLSSSLSASEVIKKFHLKALPGEGGFYSRSYTAQTHCSFLASERSTLSCIYYLITQDNFSALHKIHQDEIFHFYGGDSVRFFSFSSETDAHVEILGSNFAKNESPQKVVRGGTWQGLKIHNAEFGWSLLGTTVSPAFDFKDFELAQRSDLQKKFPQLHSYIHEYTRS